MPGALLSLLASTTSSAQLLGSAIYATQITHKTAARLLFSAADHLLLCRTSAGSIVHANQAAITVADIPAGNAVVHLVTPLVAAAEHQDFIDALQGFALPTSMPTLLWQDTLASASSASELKPQAGGAMQPGNLESTPSPGMTGPAGPVAAAPSMHSTAWPDAGDDASVNYDFEQDFTQAEQGIVQSSTGASHLDSMAAQEQQVPTAEVRSSAHMPGGNAAAFIVLVVPLLLACVL